MTAVLTAAPVRLTAPTFTTLPEAIAANVRRVRRGMAGASGVAGARAVGSAAPIGDAPKPRTHAPTIMAVVKADGYGHGALAVAEAAVAAGAEWLGVTEIAEAVALRDAGFTVPILSWLNAAGIDAAVASASGIDVAVGSVDELRQVASDARERVRVHLHMDTGMARGGCPIADWGALLELARSQRGRIEVVGVMGHLPHADQGDPAANVAAVLRMRQARDAVLRAGFGPLIVHLAATAGTVTDPNTHFGMVRIGAGLVGIDPSESVTLTGAGRLTASVVHSAIAPRGTAVGYGGGWTATAQTHLAVVGVGYADGIPREAVGAAVSIDGRRYPVVGRVSMDQIVVDTGDDTVPRGATATVFGPEGGAVPSMQEWARWAGTIPHTLVTGIGPRVRREVQA